MLDQNVRQSAEYKEAVFWLFNWQKNRESTSFYSNLFTLMKKADYVNRFKLDQAFPVESLVLHDWEKAGNYGDDLFREFGLML